MGRRLAGTLLMFIKFGRIFVVFRCEFAECDRLKEFTDGNITRKIHGPTKDCLFSKSIK